MLNVKLKVSMFVAPGKIFICEYMVGFKISLADLSLDNQLLETFD